MVQIIVMSPTDVQNFELREDGKERSAQNRTHCHIKAPGPKQRKKWQGRPSTQLHEILDNFELTNTKLPYSVHHHLRKI